MAFAKDEAVQNDNNVSKFEKAAGFLNVYVEMADGSKKQVGGIRLMKSKALHEALINAGDLEGLKISCDMNVITEQSADDFAFASVASK
ncbi:MAG: hypothetical protein ACRBB6_04325 [Neptuniibacter sp.]